MIKHVTVAIALLAAPAAVLSGCGNQSGTNESTSTTSSTTGAASAQKLTTQLKTSDGKAVADADIDFADGYATVTVQTVSGSTLSPGFHSMHIHQFGRCEGDFASAGEHLGIQGNGKPASGDLPPLLVRSDGQGKLVATTDAFTEDQLKGADGSSIVLHQGSELPGSTQGAETRIACGVISPAKAETSVSTSTSTSTSTVTTTAVAPAPGAGTETTTPPTTSETTVTPTTGATTTPVTTTPTTTVTTTPPNPPANP